MKLYLVRWLNEAFYYQNSFCGGKPDCAAADRIVRAFVDPIAAEDYRQYLEDGRQAPPRSTNPFKSFPKKYPRFYDGVFVRTMSDITHFSETEFMNYIRECGLAPPEKARLTLENWCDWWEQHKAHMTESQRGHLWRALNKIRFFEIVETETE